MGRRVQLERGRLGATQPGVSRVHAAEPAARRHHRCPYIASFVAQRTSGPVVLVGHSYGGFVITNAAATPGGDGGEVKVLVYVDAFAPDEGETVFQILGGSGSAFDVPDPTTVSDLVGYPGGPDGDLEAFLKASTVHDSFAQDLPGDDRWLIVESQRPITLSANATRQGHPDGSPCPAGPSWEPTIGSSQRPRSDTWPNARARRSQTSRARMCRWCPARK
jgi:thioesterase domain-containing protein